MEEFTVSRYTYITYTWLGQEPRIATVAGRTSSQPTSNTASSHRCVRQARAVRPAGLGVGERCGRVGYTRKRECNIPGFYTRYSTRSKYAGEWLRIEREKKREVLGWLTSGVIVLILVADCCYFLGPIMVEHVHKGGAEGRSRSK